MNQLFTPSKSVQDHLRAAIEDAIEDLNSGPIGGVTDFWLRAGNIAIELRRRLLIGPGDAFLDQQVAELITEEPNSSPLEFIHVLNEDAKGNPMPPFRYAISIQLARRLTQLLPSMEERLYQIDAQLSKHPVSPAARPYISNAVEAYLSTLDAAVPPLARAGFEHAAQDWLTTSGGMKRGAIRKKSAGDLLDLFIARSTLSQGAEAAAGRVIRRGNDVMHRGGASTVSPQDAASAIGDLTEILAELVPQG